MPPAAGGVAVAPGDPAAMAGAILALAADAERRRELGRAGRRFAETHLDRELILARYERAAGPALPAAAPARRARWPRLRETLAAPARRRRRPCPYRHAADGARPPPMIATAPSGSLKIYFEYWPVVWLWPVSLVLMQLTLLRSGRISRSLWAS